MHQTNLTRLVFSPPLRFILTTRPIISSSKPSVNVIPDPPATRRAFSKFPRSMLEPPYGPSSITLTCKCCFSARRATSFKAYDQSPLTRTPKIISPEDMQEIGDGELAIVSGCDSSIRPEKNTLSRRCCPATQPPSQP